MDVPRFPAHIQEPAGNQLRARVAALRFVSGNCENVTTLPIYERAEERVAIQDLL